MTQRVALVTGSTSGIGLGIAHRLAKSGNDVIITGLGEQDVIDDILNTFKSTYSGRTSYVAGDLFTDEGVAELCTGIHSTYSGRTSYVAGDLSTDEGVAELCTGIMNIYPGGIDVLINNAGVQHVALTEDYPIDKWHNMVAVQLTAPFLLIRHFLPFMKKRGWGRIVSTASQMAKISIPGKTPYSATKTGLVGMTRGVALETAEFGITCNAICPGFADTELLRKQARDLAEAKGITAEEAFKDFCEEIPMKKPVPIEQIAGFVHYLCSDEAASITGADLSIDGAYTAR